MKELFFAREVDPAKFGTQPDAMVWQSWTDTYSIPWPRVREIQLEALQTRFGQMVEKIPVLATLAEEQGVKKIERIEDGAPLLFPHSFYKSYPLSFIEKARYDRLTQWLDNLTVHDLSLVNTDGIDTIDAWVGLSSIKHIARYIQPGIDLITLDPKLSSTIVGKEGFDSESTMQEVAHGIARDAGMYNQETCTNARVV